MWGHKTETTWLPVLSGNYIWRSWETPWAGFQPGFWCCCLLLASPGAGAACTWAFPLGQCCIWIPGLGAEEWLQLRQPHCQSLPLAAKWSTQISYTWSSPFLNMPVVWSDPSHNWVVTENRRINASAFILLPLNQLLLSITVPENTVSSSCHTFAKAYRWSLVWPKGLWLPKILCRYITHKYLLMQY